MADKITYRELLDIAYTGKHPRQVSVENTLYHWDGADYIHDSDAPFTRRLSQKMAEYTTRAQATAFCIEPVPDLLTDAERAYLQAVIAPCRHLVQSIRLETLGGDYYPQINLKNDDMIALKRVNVQLDLLLYAGLEKDTDYTIEELGL